MARYLGIDIGTTSVKAAVLRVAYRKIVLEGLASAAIAVDGDRAAAIREAAQMALGEGAADAIATAIPGAQTTLRTVRIPEAAQRQLADVLPFELESQLPFDLDDAIIDYRILEDATNEEGLAVLTAVTRVEDAKKRVDIVMSALGAEPEHLGVGPFPLANLAAYSSQLGASTVALLDLGTKTSDILFLRSGEPVFARTLSLGTEGLPQSAAKLAREIRLSLAAYRAQGGSSPDQIFLCGGGAFVSGAESFLAAELERPVHRLPALSLELGERAAPAAHELPLHANAIGLALSLASRDGGFDMRKGPLAYERGYGWMRDRIPALVGLGSIIAVSFIFSSCTAVYAASKERTTLETALGTVTKEVFGEETTSAERATELLSAQAATEEDPLPHADSFDVMVRLSEHIPQSMTHDIEELDIQKNHVVVHGVVGTITEAQSIVTSLATEKCFSEVKNTRISQVVGGERQKYVIEFDLKCPEDVKVVKKKTDTNASSSSSGGASQTGK